MGIRRRDNKNISNIRKMNSRLSLIVFSLLLSYTICAESNCSSNSDCSSGLCVARRDFFCGISNFLSNREDGCGYRQCAECVGTRGCKRGEICSDYRCYSTAASIPLPYTLAGPGHPPPRPVPPVLLLLLNKIVYWCKTGNVT